MKDSKLFIRLLVAFLILICALAIYGGTVGVSSEVEMMPYDFVNFTMDIPKGSFLDESLDDNISTFKDTEGNFLITYMNSDGIYDEMINLYVNSSNNSSVEYDDDLVIVHLGNNGIADSSFSELFLKGNDDQVVLIQGNDVDLLKNMTNSLKFNQE